MPITMYDSTDVNQIPPAAQAVAGYTAGRWPTYPELVKRFPKAHVLSIAVASRYDADCVDVERGDVPNSLAAGWVKRQLARGVQRPVVYTSVSNAQALLGLLAQERIKRSQIRLWTAHYTGKPHLCSPACWRGFTTSADATQYTDRALGRTLDASLCRDDFFGAPKPSAGEARKQHRWRSRRAAAWRRVKRAQDYIRKLNRLIGRKP